MAPSTWGSPTILAKAKVKMLTSRPAIMPRTRRLLTMNASSVAGEGEQVAALVYEFVHVKGVEDGGGACFHTDEEDGQQQKHAAEDGPGQQFANGNGYRLNGRSQGGTCVRGVCVHSEAPRG